jgi:hypothetical protein
MSLADDAKRLQHEAELRDALARSLRELDKAKASRAELVDAVYRAAKDAAASMRLPAVPKPPKDRRKDSPEVAICLLADWQLGKTTPEYDSETAVRRVEQYAEKVVRLIELQRTHHPVNEARIYLLGDLLEGEEIFPGQAHRIDASLYQQVFRGAEALAGVVRTVAAAVPNVTVKGAIGNHGAIGGPVRKAYHPESNADAMLYNVARMLVARDKRVDWPETFVAGERAWYATDEVMGHRWFLFHGDQIKGGAFGFPWYGFGKKLLGWATSVAPFTFSASGHFHVPVRFQMNAITHWGAGSTESANTFAQEYLASGGQKPSQWLLFQNADGITAEYLVTLD